MASTGKRLLEGVDELRRRLRGERPSSKDSDDALFRRLRRNERLFSHTDDVTSPYQSC